MLFGWFLREGMSEEEYDAEHDQTVMNQIDSADDRRRIEAEKNCPVTLPIKDAESANRYIEKRRWFPRWN